jgi:hypothetical protein
MGITVPLVFEPATWYYVFMGGLLVLMILSRVARINNPKQTRRQQRKAEKRAEAAAK